MLVARASKHLEADEGTDDLREDGKGIIASMVGCAPLKINMESN